MNINKLRQKLCLMFSIDNVNKEEFTYDVSIQNHVNL